MRSTVDLSACGLKDPALNLPPTDTASQTFTFKHGAGQSFRIRSRVDIGGAGIAANGSNFVRLGPFWTTPATGYVLDWVGFSILSDLGKTGTISTVDFTVGIEDLGVTPNYSLISVPSGGSFSGGTYSSTSGSNRVRMSMAGDPGFAVLAAGGNGNQDFHSGVNIGIANGAGSSFQIYGATGFSKPIYATLHGSGAWTLVSGSFLVTLHGFQTS